jgi:hypothetical protein
LRRLTILVLIVYSIEEPFASGLDSATVDLKVSPFITGATADIVIPALNALIPRPVQRK